MATSKVYYCHICEDDGVYIHPYNRKEYFKHIKTNDHKDKSKMSHYKVPSNVREGILKKVGNRMLSKSTTKEKNNYVATIEYFFKKEIEELDDL